MENGVKQPAVKDIIHNNLRTKPLNKALLAKLPLWDRVAARLRSVLALLLIAVTFQVSVWGTVVLCVVHFFNHPQQFSLRTLFPGLHRAVDTEEWGTVIITGGKMTKALHICRHLHRAGWRTVLVETTKYWHVGARFSNCVDDFYTVPVPEDDPQGYVKAIQALVRRTGATLFVPVSSPIASIYDALVAEALPPGVRHLCQASELTAQLDNKVAFSQLADEVGALVPRFFHVTSPQQLAQLNSQPELFRGRRFVLKNLSYDSVHRADLFTLPCEAAQLAAYVGRSDIVISPSQPWILQQFLTGPEYSCYIIAHEGRVVAYSDSTAELSNLNYVYQGVRDIRQWVETFVTKTRISGQLCFDFIRDQDGQFYCIECNPRTSTVITEFHDHPGLAQAFTQPGNVAGTVLPLPASKPTYWFWNEAIRLTQSGDWQRFLRTVCEGVDAVFDPTDPLPFLALHYLQVPVLLLGNLVNGNPWKKVDLCIGKLVELYGD